MIHILAILTQGVTMIHALLARKKRRLFSHESKIELRRSILCLVNTINDIKIFWSLRQEFLYGELPYHHVNVVTNNLKEDERSRFVSALQRYDSCRMIHSGAPYPDLVSVGEVAGSHRVAYPEWYSRLNELKRLLESSF